MGLRFRPGRDGLTAHAVIERGVGNGERFGVLVLSMVFLRVDLLVLLEILGALERLLADLYHMRQRKTRRQQLDSVYLARVRLERSMDYGCHEMQDMIEGAVTRTAEMRSNMVALGASGPACIPFARQAEIIRALAPDVVVAQMVVE